VRPEQSTKDSDDARPAKIRRAYPDVHELIVEGQARSPGQAAKCQECLSERDIREPGIAERDIREAQNASVIRESNSVDHCSTPHDQGRLRFARPVVCLALFFCLALALLERGIGCYLCGLARGLPLIVWTFNEQNANAY